jgi:hypothetical protein
LQAPETGLLQLFNINNEFANAWMLFKTAANDGVRKLNLVLDTNSFPYWTKPLGMEDALTATFCSIDLKKNKLVVATQNVDFTGDADTGWSLTIDNTKTVAFNFLKSANAQKRNVVMVVSYMAKV